MRAPAGALCGPCRRAAVRGAPALLRWSYPGPPRRQKGSPADTTPARGGSAGPGAGEAQPERCLLLCSRRDAAPALERQVLAKPARPPRPLAWRGILARAAVVLAVTRAHRSQDARGPPSEAARWPILRP